MSGYEGSRALTGIGALKGMRVLRYEGVGV